MFMFLMFLNLGFIFFGIIVGQDNTLYLILPGVLLIGWAQLNVQSAFAHWSQVPSHLSGAEMAQKLLDENNIHDVSIEYIPGQMSDHYDPMSKTLRLSDSTYNATSVAAIAIAAHEVGHAIQHNRAYQPLVMRNAFAPVASFASNIWMWIFLAGMFFGFPYLIQAGVIVFSIFLIFSVITLPVEFDASRRAMIAIRESGEFSQEESTGAKKVLDAAAMTYVAGAIMTLLQLLRLLMILNRNND